MFKKILIANRGEIAVRIIRACQEMGIATVAVYSEADATALHTILADEGVLIGPPPPSQSYLLAEPILAAARQTGCQAIHPGFGFLSENAAFAEAVAEAGLTFIGPNAEAIRLMGSKITARTVMAKAGVPVVPGYHAQADDTPADLQAAADTIGYPLMVKATAGGGGKGMRVVAAAADLPAAIESAQREALKAFGDGQIFLERYIENPHHIEFQVFGDSQGNIIHLFERECSIQRRHQKIVEETPSPLLDEALRQRMGEAAVAAARAVDYVNAGTIEFLADEAGNFYFLEMNTRLQVEHPITELVTGVDLVRLQLRVAAGEPLPFQQADLSQRGHAIECRIYAEDPANGFLPDTGPLLHVTEPSGPGVRVDTGITAGDEVTLHYDPMLAKLIVLGDDRPAAIQKMALALKQYLILGVTTNIPFLQAVMAHPAFGRGETTTHFIDQHLAGWQPPGEAVTDVALIAAALFEMFGTQEASQAGTDGNSDGDGHSPWRHLGPLRLGQGGV
ncbi:MAG: acetyl-CoA carboxylase biotin carboxylase subunit [Anaerolineae bacterium]|nr:acetyl-CoA carboxylase biotin carboxylase subunit [Anaerolineae bacterium]